MELNLTKHIGEHAFQLASKKCECTFYMCHRHKCRNTATTLDYEAAIKQGWRVIARDTDYALTMENSILLCPQCIQFREINPNL